MPVLESRTRKIDTTNKQIMMHMWVFISESMHFLQVMLCACVIRGAEYQIIFTAIIIA